MAGLLDSLEVMDMSEMAKTVSTRTSCAMCSPKRLAVYIFVIVSFSSNICLASRQHVHSKLEEARMRYRRDVNEGWRRYRRETTIQDTTAAFPENTENDVKLYDVASRVPDATYKVTGSDLDPKSLFYVKDGELRLMKELSETDRKTFFNYDTHREIKVTVKATSNTNSSGEKRCT